MSKEQDDINTREQADFIPGAGKKPQKNKKKINWGSQEEVDNAPDIDFIPGDKNADKTTDKNRD